MSEFENENIDDDWKIALRSEIIKSLTGTAGEKEQVFTKVGEYYYGSAPASLYKYYSDKSYNFENIKIIKCGIQRLVILMMFLTVISQLMSVEYLNTL